MDGLFFAVRVTSEESGGASNSATLDLFSLSLSQI